MTSRPPGRLAATTSILLALLPPARMAWIVFTNGENNLSNDYLGRVPLVASMLVGRCSLGTFIREAWIGGAHSGLAIFPIYYLNARLFHWSVWVELGLGLALVAATIALLMRAIPGQTRWILLPLLSLLLFSTSRVAVFTFGEAALQHGLSQLGVATGVYALVEWRERPIALAMALAFGGLLASWSWGGGVMAWPVFAIALFLLRIRSFVAWAIFLGASATGLAQYVFFLFFQAPDPRATKAATFGLRLVLDLLGRPFAKRIGHNFAPDLVGEIAGLAGLVGLAILLLIGRNRKGSMRGPALVLLGWSLLVSLQIAEFRSGVSPWYASPMAFFWIGLALLLADTGGPLRALGIVAIVLLALGVQGTWEDKSFYLPSRAPASAACLREWRTAPTGCRERLIQWGGPDRGEVASLGEILERFQLSVFGPRRTYLLQGDVAVGRVAIETPSLRAFFSRDGVTPADPNDFHRLDLVLAPGVSVAWRVDLPPDLKTARFETRARAAAGDRMLARGARVTVDGVDGKRGEARAFIPAGERGMLSLDLRPYAGRTVILRGQAEEANGGLPLVFEAPAVTMTLDLRQDPQATREGQ